MPAFASGVLWTLEELGRARPLTPPECFQSRPYSSKICRFRRSACFCSVCFCPAGAGPSLPIPAGHGSMVSKPNPRCRAVPPASSTLLSLARVASGAPHSRAGDSAVRGSAPVDRELLLDPGGGTDASLCVTVFRERGAARAVPREKDRKATSYGRVKGKNDRVHPEARKKVLEQFSVRNARWALFKSAPPCKYFPAGHWERRVRSPNCLKYRKFRRGPSLA